MIELQIMYPTVTANSIWVRRKNGMRISDRYKQWLHDAGFLAKGQHAGKIKGPYKLTIQAKRPDSKKRDLDNILKPVSDLLVSIGAVEDDSLCEMISARWVTTGEGVHVRIEPAGVG